MRNSSKILTLFLSILVMLTVSSCRDEGVEIIDHCNENGCPSDEPPPPKTFCEGYADADHYSDISGAGTPSNPYILCHASQVASIGNEDAALEYSYRLVQDVDMDDYTGDEFQFGSCGQTNCEEDGPGKKSFNGTFDGNGNTISNFTFEDDLDRNGGGFVAILGSSGKIINLNFADATVGGTRNVGIVVGYNKGIVTQVDVASGVLKFGTGSLQNFGGVVGYNAQDATIFDVQTGSSLQIPDSADKVKNIGGIVGYNNGIVRDVVNEADVDNDYNVTGGIVGFNNHIVNKCLNTGTITGSAQVGGIAGIVSEFGSISQCSNKGNISLNTTGKDGSILQKFSNSIVFQSSVGDAGTATSEYFGAIDMDFYPELSQLFILEKENHRVHNIATNLGSDAVFGSQGTTLASNELNYPEGLAVFDGASDYIMIADTGNNVVKKLQLDGTYVTHFEHDNATAEDATGVLTDTATTGTIDTVEAAGNAYIMIVTTDSRTDKTGPDGLTQDVSGEYIQYNGQSWSIISEPYLEFDGPTDVAVDSNENIFICDTGNHRIVSLDKDGEFRFQIGTGSIGNGNSEFNHPRSVAVDSNGKIYVADTENHRIQVFSAIGGWVDEIGSYGSTSAKFNRPMKLAIRNGTLYVSDYENNRIQVFTTSGLHQKTFGSLGNGDETFNYPTGVAADASGNIYVVDYNPTMVGGIAGAVRRARYLKDVYNETTKAYDETQFDEEGVIDNSYNTGALTVTGTGFSLHVGGIVGLNNGIIFNTYNSDTGSIVGNNYIGGLVGSGYGKLKSSFNLATITATTTDNTRVGLLLGYQDVFEPTGSFATDFFTNNWNASQACNSGATVTECNDDETLTNGEEMSGDSQSFSTFEDKLELPYRNTVLDPEVIYWDFSNIWIDQSSSSEYPELKNLPEAN